MTTLEQLQARWPGLVAVAPHVALTPLEIECTPYAAYQRRRRHTYPFPVVQIAGKPRVRLTDIAAIIDGMAHVATPSAAERVPGRRPGRPRKAGSIAAPVVGRSA